MANIKTIAIVGATGTIGSAIARSLYGKYRLILMSGDEPELFTLTSDLDKSASGGEVFAVSCARDAAWEADIIIVATPYETEGQVADKIRDVAIGKIVISVSNPPSLLHRKLLTAQSSAAEQLQRLLPHSKIVKTTRALPAEVYNEKVGNAFIAGNNSDAVDTVSQVVAAIGLNPIAVGDLTVSRTLERMQLDMIELAMKSNSQRLGAWRMFQK